MSRRSLPRTLGKSRPSRRERWGLWLHREMDNRLSRLGVWAFRKTKGAIARPWNVDVLALTTTGRRTGKKRTVLLQYFGGNDALILAAANGGADSHPGWYHNLTADPRAVVEVDGITIPVTAIEVSPDEASCWWERIVEKDPAYQRYALATDRRIPIIRLSPATHPDREGLQSAERDSS